MADKIQEDQQSRLQDWIENQLSGYSLFDSLCYRRSRRFGWGMRIQDGPFAYTQNGDKVQFFIDAQ